MKGMIDSIWRSMLVKIAVGLLVCAGIMLTYGGVEARAETITVQGQTFDTKNAFKTYDVSAEQDGSIKAYAFHSGDDFTIVIVGTGEITYNKDFRNNFYYYGGPLLISDGITSIGKSAFYDFSFKSIALPDGLISIGESAFQSCTDFTSITFPDSLRNIDKNAFFRCYGLTSITIPGGVTGIGNNAFSECKNLASVTLIDGVTSIGSAAFNQCKALSSITLPDSVKSIGSSAFSSCNYLESVTLPEGITSIDNYTFSHCSSLVSITLPDGVTSIGCGAFENCTSLTSIALPASLTIIDAAAFDQCKELALSELPSGISKIGNGAFRNCKKLQLTSLPSSLTEIGSEAFSCAGVAYMHLNVPKNVATIGSNAFKQISAITYSGSAYNYGNDWGAYSKYQGFIEGYFLYSDSTKVCITKYLGYSLGAPSSGGVVVPDGVTSIGDSAFADCSGLTSVELPAGLTSIGNNAFSKCTRLTSVNIPDGVTNIGSSAFNYCTGLTSIELPAELTSIGNSAFNYCTSLTSITIPDGVTSIRDNVFYECTSLTSVDIPDGVTNIGNSAFEKCTSLASVNIPNSATSIGNRAFKDCTGLTSITVPDSVTSIGSSAFSSCNHLESVTIPENITSINDWVFSQCSSLTSITIPDGVTSIGNSAFAGTALTSIYIPDSVTIINNGAFSSCNYLIDIEGGDGLKTVASSFYCQPDANGNMVKTYLTTSNPVLVESRYEVWNSQENRSIYFRIKYDLCDGSISQEKTEYQQYEKNFVLAQPTKDGYTFVGWTGSNGDVPQKEVEVKKGSCGSLSYTANWGYSIAYNIGAGASITEQKDCYMAEDDDFALVEPTKNGYTFVGWTGSNGDTPQKTVIITKGTTGDLSYTANWEAINYNITYNVGSGSSITDEKTSYTIEDDSFTLVEPTKTGYEFTGWTGSNGTKAQKAVTITKGSTGNKEYTANWSAIKYTITYSVGDTASITGQKTSYTLEDNDFTLVEPSRTSYNFIGWTGSNGTEPQKTVTIPKGSTGNLSYTANWNFTIDDIDYAPEDADNSWDVSWSSDKSIIAYWYSSDKKLVVNGTGAVRNYTESSLPPYQNIVAGEATTVLISDGINHSGAWAYSSFTKLKNVRLPKSLWYIDAGSFYGASSLEEIDLTDMALRVIYAQAFRQAGLKELTVPSGATDIDENAFRECRSLETITIPDSVTKIGSYAFYNDTKLTEINGCNSITTYSALGKSNTYTFEVNSPYTYSYPLPTKLNTTSTFLKNTINWVSAYHRVVYNEGDIVVGSAVYSPSDILESWDVSEAQDGSITAYLFKQQNDYGRSRNHLVFSGEGRIKDYSDSDPSPFKEELFDTYYPFGDEYPDPSSYPEPDASTAVMLRFDPRIENVGAYLFKDSGRGIRIDFCYSGIPSVIGAHAFENTYSNYLPDSIQSVGERAFANCAMLTTFRGSYYNLFDVGNEAFYMDENLDTFLQTSNEALLAYDWAGSNRTVYEIKEIYVNGYYYEVSDAMPHWDLSIAGDKSVMAYYVSSDWDRDTIVIYGSGATKDFTADTAPFKTYREGDFTGTGKTWNVDINMDNGITTLGDYVLYGSKPANIRGGQGLTELGDYSVCLDDTDYTLTFRDSWTYLTKIGSYALAHNRALTNFNYYYESVTDIGARAFYVDDPLDTMLSLTNDAFSGYDWADSNRTMYEQTSWQYDWGYNQAMIDGKDYIMLYRYYGSDTDIELPTRAVFDGKVWRVGIDGSIFQNNSSVTRVVLPEGCLIRYFDSAFNGCSSLVEFDGSQAVWGYREDWQYDPSDPNGGPNGDGWKQGRIPATANNAFMYASSLETVKLPKNITSISNSMFAGCTSLPETFDIPKNITSIGESAFAGDNNITEFSGGKGLTSIGYNAFYADSVEPVATTVRSNNSLLKDYDWTGSNRLVGYTYKETVAMGDGSGNVPVEAEVESSYSVALPATVVLEPKADLSGYFAMFAYQVTATLLGENEAIVIVPDSTLDDAGAKGSDLSPYVVRNFGLEGPNGTEQATVKITDSNGSAENGIIRFLSSDFGRSTKNHEGRFEDNGGSQCESYGYIETGYLSSGDYAGIVDFTWKRVAMD